MQDELVDECEGGLLTEKSGNECEDSACRQDSLQKTRKQWSNVDHEKQVILYKKT